MTFCKKKQVIKFVAVLLFLLSTYSVAVLDTIVLQQGLNGYYGASDRTSRSGCTGLENYLLIGCC